MVIPIPNTISNSSRMFQNVSFQNIWSSWWEHFGSCEILGGDSYIYSSSDYGNVPCTSEDVAEKNLRAPFSDCVIGLPSYFTDLQRRYWNAAAIAGLSLWDSCMTVLQLHLAMEFIKQISQIQVQYPLHLLILVIVIPRFLLYHLIPRFLKYTSLGFFNLH